MYRKTKTLGNFIITRVITEINGLQKFSHKTVKRFKQECKTNQMSWKALLTSILLFSLCDFVIYTI